jgi:hypothetical protein
MPLRPRTQHASHRGGAHPCPARSGGVGSDVLHAVMGSSSVRSFAASRFPVSSLRGPVTPGLFSATTTSADFPRHFRHGSPQVRTRCFPAQPPHLPPRLNLWTSLCCASSSHRIGLLCGSCSSARRFRLAFLPPVGYPPGVGLNW